MNLWKIILRCIGREESKPAQRVEPVVDAVAAPSVKVSNLPCATVLHMPIATMRPKRSYQFPPGHKAIVIDFQAAKNAIAAYGSWRDIPRRQRTKLLTAR